MSNLLFFILATAGLTSIVVDSEIFRPIRRYLRADPSRICQFAYLLTSCHQCCGFWCGGFCSYILDPTTCGIDRIPIVLACQFAGSLACPLIADFRAYMKSLTIIHMMKEDI